VSTLLHQVFQRTGRFPHEVLELDELEQEFVFQSTVVAAEAEAQSAQSQANAMRRGR
jgi:hypothetical protein